MSEALVAGTALALERFENLELAALNNAVQGFGIIPPENCAFQKAQKACLIDQDGKPHDLESLREAAAFVVNERVEAGTFK